METNNNCTFDLFNIDTFNNEKVSKNVFKEVLKQFFNIPVLNRI